MDKMVYKTPELSVVSCVRRVEDESEGCWRSAPESC